MNRGVVILLCNLTDAAALPWIRGGYEVVMVDPQHPAGVHRDWLVTRIGATVHGAMSHLIPYIRSGRVVLVAGFPPCTDVAVSGSRWFAAKGAKDKHFQTRAALVAEQCRMVGMACGCPWLFENPVSVFSSIFGKPDHVFHPHQYTQLCAEDNYTKTTCLWTGGGFRMPAPCPDLTLGPPDDRIHKCPPSEERANIRSASPRGFCEALYEANAPHLRGRLLEAA
jgi:hypothetical protein